MTDIRQIIEKTYNEIVKSPNRQETKGSLKYLISQMEIFNKNMKELAVVDDEVPVSTKLKHAQQMFIKRMGEYHE